MIVKLSLVKRAERRCCVGSTVVMFMFMFTSLSLNDGGMYCCECT